MNKKVKPRIAQLREKVGLTQLELSRIVGVTETTVQNWESGRSGVDQIERIIRFCKALNCQVEDLIEYVPQEHFAPRTNQPVSLNEVQKLLGTDRHPSTSREETIDEGVAEKRQGLKFENIKP
ncbi:helix-turn-helix transcriptional regulator [Merismopedia glauca]|uniref:Transcriptional regulator n=1 Tax=Merismopedia glauca CCAP 1448/3 TaxID=1296344 RepID=A0A2T1C9E7_9CYAN|nr:helix-turn-helix transcriptional regulator [Merismopedia glauca]PSB04763.1 transcriptional regulator [Merismopedia glauca CCAP 1448/3]